MNLRDQYILEGVNAKNKDSWKILFDRYYPSLCSYVNKFVNNNEAAQDVVQEVFIGIWNSKQEFNDIKNLTYFLYRSCYNRALNHIRDQKSRDNKIEFIEDKGTFESEEVYEETLKEEVVRQLYFHINELPDQQKEILLLRLKGYRWNEIAEELNISINTVKTYRKRAFLYLSSKMNVSQLFIATLFFSIQMYK